MVAVHEVAGVKLVPPECVTKKMTSVISCATKPNPMVRLLVQCPGCNLKLGVRLKMGNALTFAEALCSQTLSRVGQTPETGLAGPGRVQFNIQISGVRRTGRENGVRKTGGPFSRKGLGLEDSKRYMWAEKGEWVDQPGPSKVVGRRLKRKPMW